MTASAPSNPAARERLSHIRELDGIRGIAAIMVFFHHLLFTDLDPVRWGPVVRVLSHASAIGNRGVDLFFVLSGFLITSILIQDRRSTSYYQDFYWKRALRILPLYAVCLILVALFLPASRKEVLLAVLFIANFAQVLGVAFNGPFWTLALEEQFYLLWPTVVRRRTIPQLARWAICIVFICMGLRLVAAYFGHYNYYISFLRCDGLAAGALLACWHTTRNNTPSAQRRDSLAMFAVGALGLVCLLARFAMPLTRRGIAFDADLYQTGTTLIVTSMIAYCIANSGSPLLSIFRSRWLCFFGLISYAMYMTHLYVLHAYSALRGPLPQGNAVALAIRFFVVLAATIALSLLSRYALELPAMSLRRYVLKKPAPPAEVESPLLAE